MNQRLYFTEYEMKEDVDSFPFRSLFTFLLYVDNAHDAFIWIFVYAHARLFILFFYSGYIKCFRFLLFFSVNLRYHRKTWLRIQWVEVQRVRIAKAMWINNEKEKKNRVNKLLIDNPTLIGISMRMNAHIS